LLAVLLPLLHLLLAQGIEELAVEDVLAFRHFPKDHWRKI
jgi:hypothetical protein